MNARVGGVWKQLPAGYVRVSGVWKRLLEAHVKVSGVWKEITFPLVTLSGGSAVGATLSPTNSIAAFTFNSDGTVDVNQDGSVVQISSGTDWIIPNGDASGSYEIRASLNSGDTPDLGALDTWLPLSTNRTWQFTRTIGGTSACNLTIEIRIGSAIIESGVYLLTATVV
jgi:hypothetical protein